MGALRELERTIDVVSIAKKGKRTRAESEREQDPLFRHAQAFRAGIEGAISFLKRVLRAGGRDRPAVLYHYDPSREGEVAERLLEGFQGYLQTDGYSGYDSLGASEGIVHVGSLSDRFPIFPVPLGA